MADLGAGKDRQKQLFQVEVQKEINGVEMGVLADGTPYLTESGLARMCGINRAVLNRFAVGWIDEQNKPRGRQVRDLLEKANFYDDRLFIKSTHNGVEINAYTEPVCLALLQYYALFAEETRPEAQVAISSLLQTSFRAFIYTSIGYVPTIADSWRQFHDRVNLTNNSVPTGYFCIFHEAYPLIVPLIESGIEINSSTVPDISIGLKWGAHWRNNNLTGQFGPKIEFEHNYPDYFPQAISNPQKAAAYPDAALAEFRRWFRADYIPVAFPKYLQDKANKGHIDFATASGAVEALTGQQLIEKKNSKQLKG